MPLISWSDEHCVGVREIDEQHRILVEILNRIDEALRNDEPKEKVLRLLTELVEYVEFHFRTEEDLMYRYLYVSRLPHREGHQHLLQQAHQLLDDYQSGKAFVGSETLEFLKAWFLDHVMHADRALGQYLNGRGIR